MKVAVLVENTAVNENFHAEHGLSIYVETERHKLLIDTGADGKFLENAKTLGLDISQVDTLILSHGHYDHGGGILSFCEVNPHAKIYMQKSALGEFYHGKGETHRYIGLNPEIGKLSRLWLLEGNCILDEEFSVFICSEEIRKHLRLWPEGNLELEEKRNEEFVQDDFSHEQYVVVEEGEKRILISGCAHNGILNILEQYRQLYGGDPDALFSGFHMRKKEGYTEHDRKTIEQTAKELSETQIRLFTGHCTGEEPFTIMKEILGEQLFAIHSGTVLEI